MLFGFVLASIAGFLLTVVANWTKRVPVQGATLQTLAGLWLLGRLTCLFSAALPVTLAIPVGSVVLGHARRRGGERGHRRP
jgi:uncharacterized protein involved in response to NO